MSTATGKVEDWSAVLQDARKLASGIDGELVRPEDAAYNGLRRVFNGMIDRRPALIARPGDTAAVQAWVKFARRHGLLVSIKGGGHSVPGHAVCDRGLMIDLSLMKSIRVDPSARTAEAEGGVLWGEFDAATQQHGLAVTGGRVPSTGIAGLTLGSGSGWLERKLGYTVDNVLGMEVVTADGEVLNANERENTDLFWGLRGGGGNYGIVTRFKYRLHPLGPMIYGGMLGFHRERGLELLRAYCKLLESAPDDLGGGLAFLTAPPEPPFPEDLRGKPFAGVVVCYTGDPSDGPKAIRPLLDLRPALNLLQPMPYVALQRLLEPGYPAGMQNYWKADMYPQLPDRALESLFAAASEPSSPFTSTLLQPLGGAVHRVPNESTAIGWRSAKWAIHVLGMWADPAENERHIAWVRGVEAALKPWAQEGAYLNYLMDEGSKRVEQSFGRNYARMVELKNKYDPDNFFSLNQNIKPTGGAAEAD